MFYLVKLAKNTQGQYADPAVTKYSTLKAAIVAFHQNAATLNNASDVAQATLEVMTETGVVLPNYREVISNASTTE